MMDVVPDDVSLLQKTIGTESSLTAVFMAFLNLFRTKFHDFTPLWLLNQEKIPMKPSENKLSAATRFLEKSALSAIAF